MFSNPTASDVKMEAPGGGDASEGAIAHQINQIDETLRTEQLSAVEWQELEERKRGLKAKLHLMATGQPVC
jgi:hypothetical protein